MTRKGEYKFLPDFSYFRELRRPWKLATLGLGMSWLLYRALVYDISDWDPGISFIMGGLTYLFAPWTVYVLANAVKLRPPGWPLHVVGSLFPAMLAVDWSYWLYHTAVGNSMLRWENFKVSSALYFICGIIWLYRGSVRELARDLRKSPVKQKLRTDFALAVNNLGLVHYKQNKHPEAAG